MRTILASILIFAATACSRNATSQADFYLTPLTLPDGTIIKVEQMRTEQEMRRGMMFRDSLAPDRGMLFSHGAPGNYPYWMYQVRMPLDILWLDGGHRVVEISPNTPPCKEGPASKCPQYGGKAQSLFVVELASGMVAKHGLKVGDLLTY